MNRKSLSDIAEKMRDIDFAMLATHTGDGAIAARPMSNNRQVDYEGDSYYFTWDDARMVGEIEADPQVALSFQGGDGFFVAVEGRGEVIRDRALFVEHWSDDLDQWFEDGANTDGVVMIMVRAERAHYWDGRDEGDIRLD